MSRRPHHRLAVAVVAAAPLLVTAAPASAVTPVSPCDRSGRTVAVQRVKGDVVARLSSKGGVLRGCSVLNGGVTSAIGKVRPTMVRIDRTYAAFVVRRTKAGAAVDRVWAVELGSRRAFLRDRAAVPRSTADGGRRSAVVRALRVSREGGALWATADGTVAQAAVAIDAGSARVLNADGTDGAALFTDRRAVAVGHVGPLDAAGGRALEATMRIRPTYEDVGECGRITTLTASWTSAGVRSRAALAYTGEGDCGF
jgi:hypothetical protein